MTLRKKKIIILQLIIFVFGVLVLYFTYGKKKTETVISTSDQKLIEERLSKDEEDPINTFENVEYSGIDLNGNRYTVKSEVANFENETPEIINMTVMSGIFYFKDGTILYIKSDRGIYNNKTFDIKFRDNIKANYENEELNADNLDYFNSKSFLSIYGNVKTESIKGTILADKIDFDLNLQTLKINMYDDKKVKVNVNLEENKK